MDNIEGEPKAKPEEMLPEEERAQDASSESTHNVETPQRKTFWQLYSREINVILHNEELENQEKAKRIAALKLRYFFNVLLKKPKGERFLRHSSQQEKGFFRRSVLFNILNKGLSPPAGKTRQPFLGDSRLTFMRKDPIDQIGISLGEAYGIPHEKVGYNYTFVIDPSIEVSEPYPREFTRDRISPQEIISVVFRVRNLEELEQLRRNLQRQGILKLFESKPINTTPIIVINIQKLEESDSDIYNITNIIYPDDTDLTLKPINTKEKSHNQ